MGPEEKEQKALIHWARLHRTITPELSLLFAIPNGAHVSDSHRSRLVAQGLKPGVSDLFLPVARGTFHGLWIEMKSQKGYLSEAQKQWLEQMENQSYAVSVCRTWIEAKEKIEKYLTLK